MVFLKAFFAGTFFPPRTVDRLKHWNRIYFPGQFDFGVGLERQWLPRFMSPFTPLGELLGFWGQSGAFAFHNPQRDLFLTGTVNQLSGFAGHTVSGLIWLAAAAVGTLHTRGAALAVLFLGSMGIFLLTQAAVRLAGRPGTVSSENGLWPLDAQTAFTVPIGSLLVGAATLFQQTWFFPAAMIVVGAAARAIVLPEERSAAAPARSA